MRILFEREVAGGSAEVPKGGSISTAPRPEARAAAQPPPLSSPSRVIVTGFGRGGAEKACGREHRPNGSNGSAPGALHVANQRPWTDSAHGQQAVKTEREWWDWYWWEKQKGMNEGERAAAEDARRAGEL